MVDSENPEDSTQASSQRLSDRTEGECDDTCGYLFEWRGGYEP